MRAAHDDDLGFKAPEPIYRLRIEMEVSRRLQLARLTEPKRAGASEESSSHPIERAGGTRRRHGGGGAEATPDRGGGGGLDSADGVDGLTGQQRRPRQADSEQWTVQRPADRQPAAGSSSRQQQPTAGSRQPVRSRPAPRHTLRWLTLGYDLPLR